MVGRPSHNSCPVIVVKDDAFCFYFVLFGEGGVEETVEKYTSFSKLPALPPGRHLNIEAAIGFL